MLLSPLGSCHLNVIANKYISSTKLFLSSQNSVSQKRSFHSLVHSATLLFTSVSSLKNHINQSALVISLEYLSHLSWRVHLAVKTSLMLLSLLFNSSKLPKFIGVFKTTFSCVHFLSQTM
jgi:hypothetical protein